MNEAVKKHFKKNDPVLYSYIKKIELSHVEPPEDLFSELCDTIINQQLSNKAALTIFTRFQQLFSKKKVTAKALLKMSNEKIRKCGTSFGKIKSLKDLAKKVSTGELDLKSLKKLPDGEVVIKLTSVHGIGPWTAEMFLMFGLGREDIFSHGDLGLRNGIRKIYKFKKEPKRAQIEKIVSRWKPYRTYGSRILWRALVLKED